MDASDLAHRVVIAEENLSDVQMERLAYVSPLPEFAGLQAVKGEATVPKEDKLALQTWFPSLTVEQPIISFTAKGAEASAAGGAKLKVGVLFCGRQTPGAANVVAGLFDYLTTLNPENEVIGFEGGSLGLFAGKALKITAETLRLYRNQGGMHLLGRSVDKIRSAKEQEAALATCQQLGLDGLVLIGGTITSSDAAHLAESFEASHLKAEAGSATRKRICVVAVPAGIDGDYRNEFVEIALGHHTATRVYSQLAGNIATDALSAKKYWFCTRLMGRATGSLTCEVALQTQPTYCLLPEDLEHRRVSLFALVNEVADLVEERSKKLKKNFGVMLIAEGVLNAIPEIKALLSELDVLMKAKQEAAASAGGLASPTTVSQVTSRLTPWSAAVLNYLPPKTQAQLLLPRESGGGVQLSQVSTEAILSELVAEELKRRASIAGTKPVPFATINSSLGYQARSSLPSNFDCALGTALGQTAGALVAAGANGYCATMRGLTNPDSSQWKPCGVPLTAFLAFPQSSSSAAFVDGSTRLRPIVVPAGVDVHGTAFKALQEKAAICRREDLFRNPGPLQFYGPGSDDVTITLALTRHDYLERIDELKSIIRKVEAMSCRPGVPDILLDAAWTGMSSLAHILDVLAKHREGGSTGASASASAK